MGFIGSGNSVTLTTNSAFTIVSVPANNTISVVVVNYGDGSSAAVLGTTQKCTVTKNGVYFTITNNVGWAVPYAAIGQNLTKVVS